MAHPIDSLPLLNMEGHQLKCGKGGGMLKHTKMGLVFYKMKYHIYVVCNTLGLIMWHSIYRVFLELITATLFCWFTHSGLLEMFAEDYISLLYK